MVDRQLKVQVKKIDDSLLIEFPIPRGAWEITGQSTEILDAEVLYRHGERLTISADGKVMVIDHKEKKRFRYK
jgi:hypothetical protein